MTNNIQNLPPELQQRIAQIIAQGQASGQPQQAIVSDTPPPTPAPRQPSLMDHVIALRQEVAQLSQMVQAQGQVTEAVGNAVGQLYQMFQAETQPTSYSAGFEAQAPSLDDDY
jgi:hypothetical protein